MPQMAPISWLTLFILFSILYILYAMLNYFSAVPTPQQTSASIQKLNGTPYNWKW
uniref:ATP synthase complex subunit 8 n=1 Tax=Caenis sp. JYZ-2018 TaxID=2493714 RepID=A0A3S8Q073_9INSE|nr:ATP synthase F0 subunit 8 [Caenis sp. JYZ-2018]